MFNEVLIFWFDVGFFLITVIKINSIFHRGLYIVSAYLQGCTYWLIEFYQYFV
jgi:hypothetical protein